MKENKKKLIILTGPTAVGKTALSIRLAKAVNGEIISADSMQVYQKMDIGTAKILPEQMQGITHYLVDELDPGDDFNVVRFKEYANQYMKQIYAKGKIPILVGGTGFYIQAVLHDVSFEENGKETEYRQRMEKLEEEKGCEYLHGLLQNIDPKSADAIHANNVKRVIRALEYFHQTGQKISEHNEEQRQKESPYQFAYFVLSHNRDVLYERINQRVDQMMQDGLVNEVAALRDQGYARNLVSMQGLGYKEIYAYLEGEMTLEEAVYVLKRDTRHFAKRQMTWFKREKDVIIADKSRFEKEADILNFLMEKLREREII